MAYRLGLYEKALPGSLSLEEKLGCAAAAGFDWLEISVDETDEKLARLDWGKSEIARAARAVSGSGVPISTMCLSGHRRYPLGSRDAATRRQALSIMQRALDLSERLGVRIIQLAGYDVYYEEGGGDTRELFAESLVRCVEMACEHGVLLGFETMETPFMDTVAKAMRYVDALRSPYLGVYPDVGNLTNACLLYGGDVASDLELGRGRVLAAHLKETKPGVYRGLFFGEGHTDCASAVATLYGMGVRMFTGEFWYRGGEDWRGEAALAASYIRGQIEQGIEQSGGVS